MEKEYIEKEKENKYWIKEGNEVCHRDMNNQKMMVDRILYRHVEIPKIDEGNDKQSIRRLIGVECHWVDEDGKYMQGRFHTKELIPYDVAVQGTEAIKKWDINRLNKK